MQKRKTLTDTLIKACLNCTKPANKCKGKCTRKEIKQMMKKENKNEQNV